MEWYTHRGNLLKIKEDLQKVNVKDDDLFRVEKILKCKGNKVLVEWKGWPKKCNSWIDRKSLQSTFKNE